MNRTAGRLGLEALVERPQKQRINPDQPASVLSLHERHSDLDARPYTNPRCHGVWEFLEGEPLTAFTLGNMAGRV